MPENCSIAAALALADHEELARPLPARCPRRPPKMRALAGLLCIVAHAWTVTANVEKTIFLGPPPDTLLNVRPSLDTLRLDTLDPTHAPILVTQLPVRFPSESAPRGLESWYLLRGLDHGRRYEVRICWPATVRGSLPSCKGRAWCLTTKEPAVFVCSCR